MRPFLAGADDQDADRLVRAWAAEPSISDSHPSLKQRGRALGVREFGIDALASTEKNAAEFFFGTSARTVVSDLSTKWREETAPVWALAYAQSLSENDRLKELESTDEAAMSVEQTVERAIFAEEREGADAALGWLERALARDPESAPALFHAGRLRLARGEEAAIDLLRRASGVETFRGGALSLIEGFLRERGRVAELSAVEKELWAHGDMMEAAAAERSALSESDPIEAHGLDEAGVARWRAIVKDRSDIEAAYLHRKAMRHLASDAYYVLAVQVKIPWNRRSEPITNKVLAELVTMTPDKGWVVILNGASKSYREGMALESARIF
jgi:tetratricopeptide (TPR) repeat protein